MALPAYNAPIILKSVSNLLYNILYCILLLHSGSSDFNSSDQTVSFVRSDSSNRGCAQIAIIDDSLFEGDEQFLLRLRSFSNSQVMTGEISEACVTIREDDSKFINFRT